MENRQFNTRATMEAGLLSVISVIFMVANIYFPFAFLFMMLIIPIPLIILYVRHDYKLAVASAFVTLILMMLLSDPVTAVSQSVTNALTGLTMGYCIKNNKTVTRTLLYVTMAIIAGYVINFLLLIWIVIPNGFQGFISQVNETLASVSKAMEGMKEFYKNIGVSGQQLEDIDLAMSKINIDLLLNSFPALIVISTFINAVITFLITKSILKKLNYKVIGFKPFSELYLSNRVGAVLIIFFCVALLLDNRKVAFGVYAVSFMLMVGSILFLIVGVSVMIYFLRRKFKISKGIVVLLLILTVTQFGTFYFTLGLVDMIVDFRRLDPDRIFKR